MKLRKNEKTDKDELRERIESLGLKAIEEYFGIDLEKVDKEILKHLHNRARLAMQFEKEINLNRRAIELNYIRVFRLIAEDKKELKEMIKKAIPKYYPYDY